MLYPPIAKDMVDVSVGSPEKFEREGVTLQKCFDCFTFVSVIHSRIYDGRIARGFIPYDIGVFSEGVEGELLKQRIMNYEW